MAAIRLQSAADSLVEAANQGREQDVTVSYGTFLYEARCLKANISKYTETSASLETVDVYGTRL